MLIHNVNTSDGLTNGAQGTLEKILCDDSKVRYILIKFDNKRVGRHQRQKFKFLSSRYNLSEATPIERVSFSYTLGDTSKNHAARATVLQFPLRLSWALTSHKVSKKSTKKIMKTHLNRFFCFSVRGVQFTNQLRYWLT